MPVHANTVSRKLKKVTRLSFPAHVFREQEKNAEIKKFLKQIVEKIIPQNAV